MLDPRPDIKEDTLLWQLVLGCVQLYKDKQIYGNLHGFRCGGSTLCIKNDTLVFKFPPDYSDDQKQDCKQKYLTPYMKQLKELFKFVAEYYKNNQNDVVNEDLFTRDIFLEGYRD